MSTISNQELVNNILSSPSAPSILLEASQKLKEEAKRRAQFYNEISENEKVEFINGEIVLHSPVKKEHNDASGSLYQLMSIYVKKHKLGFVGHEKIMISLTRNDYEPDICFFDSKKSKKLKKGQVLFPAPDLVVEVLSKGTEHRDRGVKFEDYQDHKVTEYWLINTKKEIVEQYRLNKKGVYELITKSKTGILICAPIKGFSIDIRAIFDEEIQMKFLQEILTK